MAGRRMTVLQVLPALQSGGTERGVLEIGEALVREGHRSLVVSAGGRMVDQLTREGSEHITAGIGVKSPLSLRWVPFLRRLLREEKVDVVDVHSRMPGWMTWLAWKSLPAGHRPGLVTTVHGFHSVSRYSEIMCSGEIVIAVSQSIRDFLLTQYPRTDAAKIRVIHRGIDSEEYPRRYRPASEWVRSFQDTFPQLQGRRVLVLPGRLTRLKGHDLFLKLIKDLSDRGLNVHGLIVGEAEPKKVGYRHELCQQIRRIGIADLVTLTGHRSDLREIMASSELVLSLSEKPEAFGRTVAEALSLGVPVVGWNQGGVGEILTAQYPAGGVPAGDTKLLCDRAISVLNAGCAASEIGLNQFEKSRMQQETLRIYHEASQLH
ncbi:MAG: glycosyltransferase family 4 protein [Planctomyces sp.]